MSDEGVTDLSEATVITAAYNEEMALPAVLAALVPLRDAGVEVIVVDDGSTDRTAQVARDAGFRVIRLERNSGKAEAVRAGLAEVRRPKVVVIDADGTYPVSAIPAVIGLLDAYDVVLGSRTEGRGHIPTLNRLGNAVLRTAIHWFSGFLSADPLTGLYGVRREHLVAMGLRSRGFGLEAEICVKAARMGLSWTDVPITYAERIGESKLNPVRDGVVITWTIVRTLFSGPRVRPAPGRDARLRPPPLALGTTALSVGSLAIAAIILATLLGLSLAAMVDPRVPFTMAISVPGVLALAVGVFLWRVATRWGRPGPRLLAPIAVAATAGGAMLLGVTVLVADAVGLVPDAPRIEVTKQVLLIGSAVALVASPAAFPLAYRASAIRNWLESGLGSVARHTTRGELLALGIIVVLFASPVVRFIFIAPIFGFDESIYANTSRAWVEGTPNTGWSQHRSPGISLLGLPAVPFASEVAFRVIGLLSGALAVVAGWALARRLGGPAAGLVAAIVIAMIPGLLYNAGFFLTDVPSAAIVALFMMVAWVQLEERPAPSRGLLWLAPIAAAAFYVRYGASVPLTAVAVTIVILWHRRLFAAWRLALTTAALLLLLLIPHFVQSTLMTGSPIGIARMAQSLASSAYPGEALRRYVDMLPAELAGAVGGALIILGLAAWPVFAYRFGLNDRVTRAQTFVLVPALLHVALLGMVALPDVRYILLPIMLLVIAGSMAGVQLSRRLTPPSRAAVAAAVVIAATVTGVGSAAQELRRQAIAAPNQYDLIDAARLIRRDAGDEACAILGYPPPQLTWYSGCATYHFALPPDSGRARLLTAERNYIILTVGNSGRYPSGALREEYRSLADGDPFAVVNDHASGEPELEIYRVADGG
ncbi:MAG: glycosyltransferase [Chloroflexi bacterium]|nr:glycosyltransferase [Chloroflexota bacterium]